MSGVKVGDRVRATCGESVIVGTALVVDTECPGGYLVEIDGDGARFLPTGNWTVEVLPPPIPDVVGTIVRDRDGDAWQRFDGGWYSTSSAANASPLSLPAVQSYCGPLTVLWTPEVTP